MRGRGRKTLTRRSFVAASAAASATMIAAPFVRTAHAAGKLSLALWDHWVPTANNASKALIEEWGAKEKVEVQIDYVTTQGGKLYLTITTSSPCPHGGRTRTPAISSRSTT
jgi:ABC-type glycerol-3-phosphate transport system substrate-binding protein